MSMLEVQDLTVRYGPLTILDHVSFEVQEGQWLMIIGPNGAGKSTIINAVSRSIAYEGQILIHDQPAARMKSRELARRIGVLSQNHFVGYDFTVEEVVRLGGYSHRDGPLAEVAQDEARFEDAIRRTGLEDLLHHSVKTLSGGELQRAFLAQLFVQDPQILMLDEPTNHLDPVYQKQVFSLVLEWLQEPGRTVVTAMHDLSLAKAFGTHALLLRRGQVIACGPTDEVMQPANLNDVYGMDVCAWMQQIYGGMVNLTQRAGN